MPVSKTPIERAEELLPQIDSIFCATLSGKGAKKVIREGRSVLRELKRLAAPESSQELFLLIDSLQESIKQAKLELERCEK